MIYFVRLINFVLLMLALVQWFVRDRARKVGQTFLLIFKTQFVRNLNCRLHYVIMFFFYSSFVSIDCFFFNIGIIFMARIYCTDLYLTYENVFEFPVRVLMRNE